MNKDMKAAIQKILEAFAGLIPYPVFPVLVKRDVVSIFYHAVSDQRLDHVRHLYPVVPVEDFENALLYLKQHFDFISYEQLYEHRIKGAKLPPKAAHISFDDGFAECFTVVRPILLKHQVPCTFFLTLDWVDNRMLYFRHSVSLCVQGAQDLSENDCRDFFEQLNKTFGLSLETLSAFTHWITHFRTPEDHIINEVCQLLAIDVGAFLRTVHPYLTTDQICQMHAEDFTIGAHSITHRKLQFASDEEIETEIVQSCQEIRNITGQEIVPFSFPHSAGGVNRALLADILDRNPSIGLLFDTKGLRQDANFMVNRVWAERPLTSEHKLHSVPEILRVAYQDAWVQGVMDTGRKLYT